MSIPTPLTQVCSSFTPPHPRHIGGNDYRGYLPSTSRGFHSPFTVFPFPCPSVPPGKEWISYWEATKATASAAPSSLGARLTPNHATLLSESLYSLLSFWSLNVFSHHSVIHKSVCLAPVGLTTRMRKITPSQETLDLLGPGTQSCAARPLNAILKVQIDTQLQLSFAFSP